MPVPEADAPALLLVDIRCEVVVDCVVKDDLLLDAGLSVVVVTGVLVVVDTGALLVSFEVFLVPLSLQPRDRDNDTECGVAFEYLLLDAIAPSRDSCSCALRLRALSSLYCSSLSAALFFALGFDVLFDRPPAIVLKLLCCRLYHLVLNGVAIIIM